MRPDDDRANSQQTKRTPSPPDFGPPLDEDELLAFAEIDEADIVAAMAWFDEHASPEWRGALDAVEAE